MSVEPEQEFGARQLVPASRQEQAREVAAVGSSLRHREADRVAAVFDFLGWQGLGREDYVV